MAHSLNFRISDIQQQLGESGTTCNQQVNDVLDADDKLISSLQKLGCELEQRNPEEAHDIEQLREMCMR